MKYFTAFILILSIQFFFGQNITVDENYTAQQLIQNVLLNSPCTSVSNISVSGGNFSSGEKSYGYFDGNNSSFPFEKGIILSTGKINNAPGPNSYVSDDGSGIGWNGDTDLNQALNISNSINATVLEFDFIPLGGHISFDYIFSSEEYHGTATCQYSDGFAFLLREVGTTTYQNLALIPNTNIPVKVTSVHPNIPGGCGPQNEQYFDAFNGTNYPTNYNGQTKSLTAQANVIPGTQYHIKLVIADEGNYRYDSAIFLKGGSFNFGVDLGENRTIGNGNPVCYDESTFTLDATTTGATQYQWKLNGQDIIGEINSTLSFNPPFDPITQNGTYSVAVSIGSCASVSEIELEFTENLITNPVLFEKCDEDDNQDGITTFSLTDFESIRNQLFNNLPSNYQVAFFESESSLTPIASPFTNTIANTQVIYARILNFNCYEDFPVTLKIKTFDQIIVDETIGICENNSAILDAGNGFASYTWNTNPAQNTQTITVSNSGIYSVILENTSGCFRTKTFTVVSSQIATIENIQISDFSENNTATINTGNGNYEFSLNGLDYQDSNVFTNLSPGEYTVYVNDKNNCGETSKTFYILDYPKFFTPNGDGYNDTWQIANLNKRGLENSKVFIFDRYGKLLKQISTSGEGWNGTYNGYSLPSEDYWFVIELVNGKIIRNHFTLKR